MKVLAIDTSSKLCSVAILEDTNLIKKLELDNFMIFNHLDVEFSPDINIISGENSMGKTALIKILYSCMKG